MMQDVSSESAERSLLAAQVVALVVHRLFPKVILMGGGTHSLGFYYDCIFEKPLTDAMLELIELNTHQLIKAAIPVRSISMMRENAQTLLEHHGHFCLGEIAGEQVENILELIQIEQFYGLSPSTSLTETSQTGYVKLLEYEKLSQDIEGEEVFVTRLIGTAKENPQALKAFIKNYHQFLKKKDHRFLGPQLKLFSFEERNPFGVIWHPKGMQLKETLWRLLHLHMQPSVCVATPLVLHSDVLKTDSYSLEPFDFQGEEYCLRSRLQVQHLEYLSKLSLEAGELPWRMKEQSTLFQAIPRSQRWGLLSQCEKQTEHMTISCLKEQVISELISSLHFIEQIITLFRFEARWILRILEIKHSLGKREELIEMQSVALQTHLGRSLEESDISKASLGETTDNFSGLQLLVRDVLGREWSIARLSVAFQTGSPELTGHQKRFVVTQQFFESIDSFIALLLEQYSGVLPFWLAPEQVRVIVIGEANRSYADEVIHRLRERGIRVSKDIREAKLSIRVHEAEREQIPYILLIGEQERLKQTISVRVGGKSHQKQTDRLEAFLDNICQDGLNVRDI